MHRRRFTSHAVVQVCRHTMYWRVDIVRHPLCLKGTAQRAHTAPRNVCAPWSTQMVSTSGRSRSCHPSIRWRSLQMARSVGTVKASHSGNRLGDDGAAPASTQTLMWLKLAWMHAWQAFGSAGLSHGPACAAGATAIENPALSNAAPIRDRSLVTSHPTRRQPSTRLDRWPSRCRHRSFPSEPASSPRGKAGFGMQRNPSPAPGGPRRSRHRT